MNASQAIIELSTFSALGVTSSWNSGFQKIIGINQISITVSSSNNVTYDLIWSSDGSATLYSEGELTLKQNHTKLYNIKAAYVKIILNNPGNNSSLYVQTIGYTTGVSILASLEKNEKTLITFQVEAAEATGWFGPGSKESSTASGSFSAYWIIPTSTIIKKIFIYSSSSSNNVLNEFILYVNDIEVPTVNAFMAVNEYTASWTGEYLLNINDRVKIKHEQSRTVAHSISVSIVGIETF